MIAGNCLELFAWFFITVSQLYYILQMDSLKIFLESQSVGDNQRRQKYHRIKSFLLIFAFDMCGNFFFYVYLRQIIATDSNPFDYDPFSALGILNNLNKVLVILFMTYFEYRFLKLLFFMVFSKLKSKDQCFSEMSRKNKVIVIWMILISVVEYLFIITLICLMIMSDYIGITAHNGIIYTLVSLLELDLFPYMNLVIGLNLLFLFYFQTKANNYKLSEISD